MVTLVIKENQIIDALYTILYLNSTSRWLLRDDLFRLKRWSRQNQTDTESR